MTASDKQLVLKPQDLLVALKVAVHPERAFLLADLAKELRMAVSQVHGSIKRAEQAKLLSRVTGTLRTSQAALKEFVIHGAKYAYPGQLGALSRGMPTAVGAPALSLLFDRADELPPVWPDPGGDRWGPSLSPLHPCVPEAAKIDEKLYELLSLLDALRVGAARERKMALDSIELLL